MNGGLHLIFALGTAEKYDSDGQGRAVRNRSSLAFTKQMLADASQLLEKLESGTSVELGISVPSVVLRLLAEVGGGEWHCRIAGFEVLAWEESFRRPRL
ncbi:MAG: hypothetical protein HYX45_16500 [Burkholderiales bacterium]|nr:hypothetical protein [Burkholderiales bacterium]